MQEVQVKAIGASAEFHDFQGGVVNIVTKSGSNAFHGVGSFYAIPSGLVGNNTPNEQFPYKIHYNQQSTFELGGPLKRDRVWFYGILPANRSLTTNVGVDPNLDKQGGHSYKPFAKGTVRLAEHDNLNVGWNNNMFCCGATASRTAPLITQQVEHGHNPVLTSQYTHTFGAATLMEVRAGGIYIRDNFTPYSDDFTTPGRTEQSNGFSLANGTTASKQFHNRTTVDASVAHSASDFLKGSHDFKFGVQTAYATQRTVSIQFSNVQYTDLNGAPYLATYRDPAASGGRIRSAGGYAQDNWSVNDRVTLNLGVRYDRTMGDIPPLSASATLDGIRGSTKFDVTDSTVYPAVPDLIKWNSVSPRVGLTLRADKSGKTVFKTNYGRFYGKLATSMFNSMSPGATPTTTLRFNTATGKYDIPFTFVDNKINFSVNPDLTNQYTDQVFVGVRGTYAMRDVVDSFNGVTQTLSIFNLTSPQSQRLFQVINRDDFDQSFKSAVIEVNKRFSAAWQSLASYTWQESKAYGGGTVTGSTQQDFSSLSSTAGFGRDPNDLINAFGPTATNSTHSVKLSSTYQAPLDFNFGLRYSYESGRPYGRLIIVRGLGQGQVTMLAEPRGAYTLPSVNDFQVRVDKDFTFVSNQRLRLSLDVFNIFNSDTVLTLRNNSSQVTATTPWAQTLSIVRPRTVQLGVRYQF
jgi:outer membrane receptor protein involved in Fe transport